MGKDAINNEHKVEEYDIIIMASDGLWDNLYDKDVIDCIKDSMPNRKNKKDDFRLI